MPELAQAITLQKADPAWSVGLIRKWAEMIYVLNALSLTDLAANRPATPALNHIFFTTSDTAQTFVAVNGAWQLVGGSTSGGFFAPGSFTVQTGSYRIASKRQQFTGTQRLTLQGTGRLSIIN